MQVGCGVCEFEIKGKPYLYFWHYETKAGRRVQVRDYVGPAGSPASSKEAMRRCGAYFDRVAGEVARLRRATLASLAGTR